MAIFSTFIQVIQIISALAVIGLVLMQHGKGADMGAAFGSGASGSVFGATGSANFLSRATAGAAAAFFITTLMLAFVINNQSRGSNSVMNSAPAVTTPAVPVDAVKPPTAPTAPVAPSDAVPAKAAPTPTTAPTTAPAAAAPASPAQVPKQ
jgi:preprotein translocase subunit SecG